MKVFWLMGLMVLFAVQNSFSDEYGGGREVQGYYDSGLSEALGFTLHYRADFSGLSKEKHELFGARGERPSKVYKYVFMQTDKNWVKIKADNQFGGRSYIYDSNWNVAYYIFESKKEEHEIGSVLVKHLTLKKDLPKDDEEEVWRAVLIALGYRGSYVDHSLWGSDYYKFDVCGSLGPFLIYDDLRTNIWHAVLGGAIFADEEGREKCLRGIISNYDGYSPALQNEVLEKTAEYLKTVNDDKVNYSKQIAEFVLKKGGKVPDRLYWDYDTYWEWSDGKIYFDKERWVEFGEKKVPALSPFPDLQGAKTNPRRKRGQPVKIRIEETLK